MPEPLARRFAKAVSGGYLPQGMRPSGEMTAYKRSPMERTNDWLAQNWYGDDREGYQNAARATNVAQTLIPPVAVAESMYDAGRDAGRGNFVSAGIGLGMAGLPMPPGMKKGFRAYHGSPHDFDKFSMDKIGTGEGAQAYGHGLYFAEAEETAKSYRDQLSDTKDFTTSSGKQLPSWVAKGITGYDFIHNKSTDTVKPQQIAEIRADFAQRLAESKAAHGAGDWNAAERLAVQQGVLDALDDIEGGAKVVAPGSMYEVNINADPEQFLDWDKPLSEQNPKVRAAAETELRRYFGSQFDGPVGNTSRRPLGELLDEADRDKVRSAQRLKDAGIPGIKYLDAGSRTKGNGSRNYVAFDDKLIDIVRKYGIAALLGGGATAGAFGPQPAESMARKPVVDVKKLARKNSFGS